MSLVAREPFSGSASQDITLVRRAYGLFIENDGSADVTFSAGAFTFTIKPGGQFNDELEPFNTISITATSSYRGYVRGR